MKVFSFVFLTYITGCFSDNIVELATSLGATTLVSYLRTTGLDQPLSNNGPFTVFAPTNAAFDALSENVKAALTKSPDLLKTVLMYHVADGRTYSSQLSNEMTVQSLNPLKKIRVNINNGMATVNGVKVTAADKNATNGVIHVIDHVMYPLPDGVIPAALAANTNLTTLLFALGQGQLLGPLSGEGPFTVFAPTNQAFDDLPAGAISDLLSDQIGLIALLQYHVVLGTHYSINLSTGAVPTLQGTSVNISASTNGVMVNNAKVIMADIPTSNGVIHVLDKVLSLK